MKLWRRETGLGPIGLEITASTLSAAQVRRGAGGARLWAVASVRRRAGEAQAGGKPAPGSAELPTGEELAWLAEVLARHGFRGREVVAAMPESRLVGATIELPPRSSGAPLAKLVAGELARQHRKEPAALHTQFWDVPVPIKGGSADATHVMALGCEGKDADALASALSSAGLEAVAIDARCWGMARLAEMLGRQHLGSAATSAIVLDAGESTCLLAVVRSGPMDAEATPGAVAAGGVRVIYERSTPELGLRTLRQSLRDRAGVEADEAGLVLEVGLGGSGPGAELSSPEAQWAIREHAELLAQEIELAATYSAHRYPMPIESVSLCGSAMAVPGLAEVVGSRLRGSVPAVRVVTPRAIFGGEGAGTPLDGDPGLSVACGLALRGKEAA